MAKVLSAKQILVAMRRADPANALKLTDPNEYKEVPYSEFFSVMDSLEGLSDLELTELTKLQEEMTYLLNNKDKFHFHENKLYIYFILRLQGVLGL